MLFPYRIKRTFLLLIIIGLLLNSCKKAKNNPAVQNGTIDLVNWCLEKDGSLELNGEWTFFWKKEFKDIKTGDNEKKYCKVPGKWSCNEKFISNDGYATYVLKIINIKPGIYALNTGKLRTYRFYVDGKMFNPDDIFDADSIKLPLISSKHIYPVVIKKDTAEIAITIANGPYFKTAGFVSEVSFGTIENVFAQNSKAIAFESIIAGIILFSMFNSIFLFLFRKKMYESLFFALFSLTVIMRLLLSGILSSLVFHSLSSFWYYKLFAIVTFLIMPSYMFFISYSYHEYINKKVIKVFLISCFVILLLSVFLHPVNFLSYFSPLFFYQILVICASLYVVSIYLKAIKDKKNDALIEFTGLVIFLSAVFFDIVIDRKGYHVSYIMPIGLSIFILLQSFQLSKRYSRSIEMLYSSLQKVNRLKDDFLAKTSHELRTPLHGIIGIAELLKEGVAGPVNESMIEHLTLIISSSTRLSNIINDILDFSKLKNNEIELNFKKIDLKSMIDGIVAVFKHMNRGLEIQLVNMIEENIPDVYGDENRLQQIFYNLIGNAVKFTKKGNVIISAIPKKEYIEISVTDTGIGIDKEKIDTIFKSYEQISNSGQNISGTGLGLTISKQLITLHGGKIGVESEPGIGSRFFFTIRMCKEQKIVGNVKEAHAIMGNARKAEMVKPVVHERIKDVAEKTKLKIEVLMLDDEPVNLQVISNYLRLENIKTILTTDPSEIMRYLDIRKPDLLLLDVMMPEISGFELCTKIREKFSPSELPIIMVTAKNQTADLVHGFKCGANDYIVKPFFREELIARVKAQLELKKAFEIIVENNELKKEINYRKKTEIELRMKQKRLSEMLNTIDDALIAVNENGEICFCNYALENLLGYITEDILGRKLNDVIVDSNCNNGVELENDIELAGVKTKKYTKIEAIMSSGKHKMVDILLTRLKNEDEIISVLILKGHSENEDIRSEQVSESKAAEFIGLINKNYEKIEKLETVIETLKELSFKMQAGKNEDLYKVEKLFENAESLQKYYQKKQTDIN